MANFVGILTFILTIWGCYSATPDTATFTDVLNRLSLLEMKAAENENLQKENYNLKLGMENYEKMSKLMENRYMELKNSFRKEVERMEMKYLDMVNQLQDRLDNQEATVEYLKMKCADNSQQRVHLPETDRKENDSNYTNKTRPSGLQSENLIDRINKYGKKIRPSEAVTPELQNMVENKMGGRIRRHEYQDINKRVSEGSIAFAASLGHNLDHLATGHTIAFDHVYINEGNGYNGSDGIFVCPLSGLYLFSFNLHLDLPNQHVGCEVKVNGNVKVWSFAGTSSSGIKSNAPGTTVVRLNSGDHVWLSIMYGDSHIYGGSLSNFMGVRIAE